MQFFIHSHFLAYLVCVISLMQCGTGGPAIDERGDVAGMTFGRLPNPDLLSISILQTCIDMWRRFRFINNLLYYCIVSTILLMSIKLWHVG